jgi:hypothetical protein
MTSAKIIENPSANQDQLVENKSGIVRKIMLVAVIILALIPPALVMADRWLGIIRTDVLNEIWCYYWYLCSSPVPSYFIIIFICLIALPFLIFALRNQTIAVIENTIQHGDLRAVSRTQSLVGLGYQVISTLGFIIIVVKCLSTKTIPGWELIYVWLGFMVGCLIETVAIESFQVFWKTNGEFWLALLIAHASIVGLMVGIYGKPDLLWSTIVLAVLAGANLWRFRQRVPCIFWIMSLAIAVFTIEINGWWTAAVGDEYIFHQQAWHMADRMSYQEVGRIVFSSDSLGGQYPYFSSFVQVIFMKFLGSESFGWRFSNIYLSSLAVGLFYYFCKTFISKHVSLIAAFLFAVSSCIMSFSKIGYDNLQSLFALTLVLAIAAWILKSGLKLAYVCLGSALALCFYVYPAALYAIPLPLILLVIYGFPRNREKISKWILMIFVCLSIIFPLMMQPGYWAAKVAGTLFNQPAILQTTSNLVTHFGQNLFYSFFSFLYVFAESHFITSSYVDPLSGASLLIGLIVLIIQARRQRFPLFILFTFIFFVFVIGTSHDRQYPPHTRMFLLIPIYMLIAAWGIAWVSGSIKQQFVLNNRIVMFAPLVLALVLTVLNLYQAYPLSHYRFAHTEMIESLFVRLSERVQAAEPRTTKTYAVILDKNWSVDGFLMLQKVYPHLAWAQIKQVQISEPLLPDSSKPMLSDRDTIVIIMPWMNPEWVKTLDGQIRELGKESCDVLSYTGRRLTTLYHAPNLPQACFP